MPPPKLVDSFLRRANPAVISCIRPDGYPMPVATWYDWDGERVLVNMDARRSRLAWMRENSKVGITVLGDNWYQHVSFTGDVVSIHDDRDLADIDRLAKRYTGRPFQNRSAHRVSAWIVPRLWHVWELDRK